MKAKNFSKKLVLKKKTIANLSNDQMGAAYGGASASRCPRLCHTMLCQ